MFILFIGLGLIIRFLLIGIPGFKADIAFWKGWGLAVADKGILWLVNNTNYNYPPGFAYVLWLINKIYALLADPYNINQYWMDNNVWYLFLIKMVTIVADIGIVYLLIKIGRRLKSGWGKHFALFYFLNIVVIFDGVIWGQVDQFGLALFLASFYLLLIEKPGWASSVFVISFMMKFQNIIFIPIFYLYIFKKYSFWGLINALKISCITSVVIVFPFLATRQVASLIRLFTINSDWFPWYSLNAFNLWWIKAGLYGLKLSDKTLVLGIMNAKQLGLLFFSFMYFIASLRLFLAKKEELLGEFSLVLALVVFAFFHLLTQSHERYLFPLLGLLPLLVLTHKEKNINRLLIFITVLSIGIFMNMYLSAALNYPDQVIWPFEEKFTRTLSFYISLYQIALFIFFFLQYFGRWTIKNIAWIGSAATVIFCLIFLKNFNFILGKPVSLTEIKSVSEQQEYLPPIYNKTVDSNIGVFKWNRLSNNYYFYKKGIGGHANSIISYGLGGRFSKLSTDYGIDTEGAAEAKVYFQVEGDGRTLFKSKVRGRFDPPESVMVPIKGVNILTLKITKAGESNYGAHADWLDPVLIR